MPTQPASRATLQDAADFTRVLFAHKELADMDKTERVRACYLHACLKHIAYLNDSR